MSRRATMLAVALLASGTAAAQQARIYTQSQSGPEFLVYGLPVPRPIDSQTPVEGFRSWESLHARLLNLSMNTDVVGAFELDRSARGQWQWAYTVSDEDGDDVEGRPEAAFFLNATTHAREWGAPEVAVGTIERLVQARGDRGLARYLLDNTHLVVVPVHNHDGFLMTQRYPEHVLVGKDPDFPATTPRDGRMRRKNMRGVDDDLFTFDDHLLGVDLNRNHPPFWATTPSRSSPDPASIVHHGAGPHSEPENRVLEKAAGLAPVSRLRLGIDVHSFGKVFFTSNTARTRLNAVQRSLVSRLVDHHAAVSGAQYQDVPDPPNRGIGAAAEYMAYTWLVPSWTLELEPTQDAQEYGGTALTHSGFILPASQARRVRESWAETHLVAFYRMAGPPHLARVRLVEVESGTVALQTRWRYDAASARRVRTDDSRQPLAAGRRYRVELAFSKPMRHRNGAGEVAPLPGEVALPPPPSVALFADAARTVLDTGGGRWETDAARTLRYRDDTYSFEFTAPAALRDFRLEVAARDMTGLALDADPATPADWAQGAWSEWEDAAGVDGDAGGADGGTVFSVGADPAQVTLVQNGDVAGEGDAVLVPVGRNGALPGELELRRTDTGEVLARWESGDGTVREFLVRIPDNLAREGDRWVEIPLGEFVLGVQRAATTLRVRVLDNDSGPRAVYAVPATSGGFLEAWQAVNAPGRAVDLVVRRRPAQVLPVDNASTPSPGIAPLQADVALHGNGVRFDSQTTARSRAAIRVQPGARLWLDRVDLRLSREEQNPIGAEALIESEGTLALLRSQVAAEGVRRTPLVRNRGTLQVARSTLRGRGEGAVPLVDQAGGEASFESSLLWAAGGEAQPTSAVLSIGGGRVHSRGSTLIGFPMVTPASAQALEADGSWLVETLQGAVAPGPRTACTQPRVQALRGNLLVATPESGWTASGCYALQPGGGNAVETTAAFAQAGSSAWPILAPATGGRAIDFAEPNACAALDQRGSPRPQGARCDAGAVETGIEFQRGIWSPARAGHGLDLQASGNRLVLAWYTYEADGEPTAYQAVAPLTGTDWSATLQQSRRDPQTGAMSVRDVGSVGLRFQDATHATLRWRFTGQAEGQEAITAAAFDSGEPDVEVTGLWYPPTESGQGATVTRRGGLTALGIYYYDAEGNVRWALGTALARDAQEFLMQSFTGFCPDCDAATRPVQGRVIGRAIAHFHTPRQARLETTLAYPGAAGGSWNRSATLWVPLSDPVDNSRVGR